MKYPDGDELLSVTDPPRWIDAHFLRQDPFAFEHCQRNFHDIACSVADALDVDRNGVFCIGSGAIGVSINPCNVENGALKRFDHESDIDMAVVSARYFEIAWRDMLLATQPHLVEIDTQLEEHLSWQKKRLFDGAILTNKLLASLSFGKRWIGAIDRLSESIVRTLDRNVTVEVWVYRDYWSLRNYIARGLVRCQEKMKLDGFLND